MAAITAFNPEGWDWQDRYSINMALEVKGGQRVIYCTGQASVDEHSQPVHAGDFLKQVNKSFDNLEAVLKSAGLSLANVVRLNQYTTDLAEWYKAVPVYRARLDAAGCKPTGTLLVVAGLFHPDLMFEMEATAVA